MTAKINEQRTKEDYEITFFTDNKPLFRKARILLDELSSKERIKKITIIYSFDKILNERKGVKQKNEKVSTY